MQPHDEGRIDFQSVAIEPLTGEDASRHHDGPRAIGIEERPEFPDHGSGIDKEKRRDPDSPDRVFRPQPAPGGPL